MHLLKPESTQLGASKGELPMRLPGFALVLSIGFLALLIVGACAAVEGTACPPTDFGELSCDGPLIVICDAETAKWKEVEDCEKVGLTCTKVRGESRPICEGPPCSGGEGARRCSSDYRDVLVCNSPGDYWFPGIACDVGETCEAQDDSASCVPGICPGGATRCSANNSQVETCSGNQWTASACSQDQVCRVVGDTAQCVAAVDDCTTDLDALRCKPDDDVWIQECRNVGTMETPKMEWRDYIDCSEGSADEICIEDPNVGTSPMCGLPFT